MTKAGRQAVASCDMEPGTLVLIEDPVLCAVVAKYSCAVCHTCLHPLEKPTEYKEEVNPCLPRYCNACRPRGKDSEQAALDTALAPVRIKLHEIAKENNVESILLHLVVEMDLARHCYQSGGKAATKAPTTPSKANGGAQLRVSSTPPDAEALASNWDKKPEQYRKKVGAALRALHKELVTLGEAGTVPGDYTPSSLARLQELSSITVSNLQSVAGDLSAREAVGLGLFPALSLFTHSCYPNCWVTTVGKQVQVRTIAPVPKGTPLTQCVNAVSIFDRRSTRARQLLSDKGVVCHCERCVEPMDTSVDKVLEGVWCPYCLSDVMVIIPPSNTEAVKAAGERYKEQQQEFLKQLAALEEKKASKGKGGKGSKKEDGGGGGAKNDEDAAAAAAAAEASTSQEEEKKDEDEQSKEERGGEDMKEGEASEAQEEAREYWRCCGCNSIDVGFNDHGTGPGNISYEAAKNVQQGKLYLSLNMPEFTKQAEAMLHSVVNKSMENRLHPYNTSVMEALPILINHHLRKEEWVEVMTHCGSLWEAQGGITDRHTVTQLQLLDVYAMAARKKVENAGSSAVKKNLEKRAKVADNIRKELYKIFYGPDYVVKAV